MPPCPLCEASLLPCCPVSQRDVLALCAIIQTVREPSHRVCVLFKERGATSAQRGSLIWLGITPVPSCLRLTQNSSCPRWWTLVATLIQELRSDVVAEPGNGLAPTCTG